METITRTVRRGFEKGTECAYCGERRLPMELDHLRPRCRGGSGDQMIVSCVSCNRQKGTMLLHEWMAWRKKTGLSWPPVASHASSKQPEHYSDGTGCDACRSDGTDGRGDPDAPDLPPTLTPEHLYNTEHGYLATYRCSIHRLSYKVGWGILANYYSDCTCAFCVAMCLEDEAIG